MRLVAQAGHSSSEGTGQGVDGTHVPAGPAGPGPCPRSHCSDRYLLELGKEGAGLLLQHSPVLWVLAEVLMAAQRRDLGCTDGWVQCGTGGSQHDTAGTTSPQ